MKSRAVIAAAALFCSMSAVGQTNTFPASGNVGIGTTAPSQTLEVIGNVGIYQNHNNSPFIIDVSGMIATNPWSGVGITAVNNGGDAFVTSYINNWGGSYNWTVGSSSGPVTWMTISNGNVGIGTTNPQYRLSVNGTIQAKEVLVNTGWSDYVFDPNYHVKPLPKIAAFIKANHHLPDIPSAAEVKENGVSLGEMPPALCFSRRVESSAASTLQSLPGAYADASSRHSFFRPSSGCDFKWVSAGSD